MLAESLLPAFEGAHHLVGVPEEQGAVLPVSRGSCALILAPEGLILPSVHLLRPRKALHLLECLIILLHLVVAALILPVLAVLPVLAPAEGELLPILVVLEEIRGAPVVLDLIGQIFERELRLVLGVWLLRAHLGPGAAIIRPEKGVWVVGHGVRHI